MHSTEIQAKSILEELGFIVKPASEANPCDKSNVVYSQYTPNDIPNIRLDFALPYIHIAIEIDGYWHGRSSEKKISAAQLNIKISDTEKDKRLREKGWKVIRIGAEEMMDNPRKMTNHLRSSIFAVMEI